MRKLASFIFDPYDDAEGQVLRQIAPTPEDIPDFVKTAERFSPEQLHKLPDDQFALIMFDGTDKLRKYAMTDVGNTVLSSAYLLRQAYLLPPEAVKIAAANLLGACERFGLPTEALKLAAATGYSPVAAKLQKNYKSQRVIKTNFPVEEPPKESVTNPQLGKSVGDSDMMERTNYNGMPGTNFVELPIIGQKERRVETTEAVEKRAEVDRYVDVSAWDPDANVVEEQRAPELLLIDGHPVDSYDQVKTAAEFFGQSWKNMHPRARHEYCVKLAARMTKLGMEIPEAIDRYGSETYSMDVDSMVQSRRTLVDPELHPALDALLEKRAQVQPSTFAEALADFDQVADLHYHWDSDVPDPWVSTFGPSVEKLAALEWTFDGNGARCDENDLKRLALNGKLVVKRQFGHDFTEKFTKNPKSTFEALPEATKVVLARMAMDVHTGLFSE